MNYNNDFKFDLQIGQVYERKLGELIGGDKKVEVKRDFQATKTGNIFVEYHSRNKPSGISTTEAEYYCYWLDEDLAVFIGIDNLKTLCRQYYGTERNIRGGDMNTSRGILLPVEALVKRGRRA